MSKKLNFDQDAAFRSILGVTDPSMMDVSPEYETPATVPAVSERAPKEPEAEARPVHTAGPAFQEAGNDACPTCHQPVSSRTRSVRQPAASSDGFFTVGSGKRPRGDTMSCYFSRNDLASAIKTLSKEQNMAVGAFIQAMLLEYAACCDTRAAQELASMLDY